MTAGIRSSEFALTVIVLVGVGLLSVLDIDAGTFLDTARYLVPGYAISRGVAKRPASE